MLSFSAAIAKAKKLDPVPIKQANKIAPAMAFCSGFAKIKPYGITA